MMKPLIAVDLDDVLVPRVHPVIDFLNRQFGFSLNVDNMISGSFSTFVCESLVDGITPHELSRLIEDYLSSSEYIAQQPIEGAIKAVRELHQRYRLWVLSTRPRSQHFDTHNWLAEHFEGVFEKVALINNGSFGFDDIKISSKDSFCVAHNITLLIDDKLMNCLEVAKLSLKAVLFGNYPWNQSRGVPSGIIRCNDWATVLEYL